ncbi:MAG: molybdenum cofactor biosynthesis protein B [Pseudomonadales bacterium]|jgi:molybdenum cofactor biosynthesis protein B
MAESGAESLSLAVLTVSDTRTEANDTSGDYLVSAATEAGHQLVTRTIEVDDRFLLRARISQWIADPSIQVILVTGGTGFTSRDATPEAIRPLLEVIIDGFGELFRQLSYEEIGTSTIQSRALAGISNNTLVFCIPGSTGACKTAWNGILSTQLDSTHRPCNFAELVLRGHH